ncbi:MAG TPA: hypothetical protein VHC19_18825 [Pirellulales bacterium]|jgi:hypothetical protein|nr:hypothetical protein [Pirellulales bacterium]
MRALCGAIITAGALIGLGLTSIGYGLRYQGLITVNPDTDHLYGAPSMTTILVTLLIAVLIGLSVAFLGLAFHHHRRYMELVRLGEPPDQTNAAA